MDSFFVCASRLASYNFQSVHWQRHSWYFVAWKSIMAAEWRERGKTDQRIGLRIHCLAPTGKLAYPILHLIYSAPKCVRAGRSTIYIDRRKHHEFIYLYENMMRMMYTNTMWMLLAACRTFDTVSQWANPTLLTARYR